MVNELIRHTRLVEIVGDTAGVKSKMRSSAILRWSKMWMVKLPAKVIELDGDVVSLQVFAGGKGLSTDAEVSSWDGLLTSSIRRTFWGGSSAGQESPSTEALIFPPNPGYQPAHPPSTPPCGSCRQE